MHPLDDLKSNFRSWEDNETTSESAEELFGILCNRHPDFDKDKLKDMAYHWVGASKEDGVIK